ncbi:MAG: hypothetical protein JNL34_01510 [Anaerolineae bacterium]|nr:hypothetical protein [Anaerolineae bacterium]
MVFPWLLVIGLLVAMRRLEGWLHQHIFKVGWLITKNLHTTTILYYTFFLPGVVFHEFVLWLVAGVFNVRAERAIAWPEAQAIAELKLNFIRLSKNTSAFKVAVISVAPLLAGIALIAFVLTSVMDISGIRILIASGSLDDVNVAIGRLTATPDFWLWFYLIFAVANTMMPEWDKLKGWRPVLIVLGVGVVLLFLLGVGDELFVEAFTGPLATLLSLLAGSLIGVIAINLVMTGVLGGIESLIERVTGDSATFQNGKLVAMRREEILKQKEQARQKQQKQLEAAKNAPKTPGGPPSIYKLPLPIPGAPGKEAEALPRPAVATLQPTPGDDRAGPVMITGTATPKPPADEAAEE